MNKLFSRIIGVFTAHKSNQAPSTREGRGGFSSALSGGFALSLLFAMPATAADIDWFDGSKAVTYSLQKNVDPVVMTAADMFAGDMEAVTGRRAVAAKERDAAIVVVEADRASSGVLNKLKRQGVPIDSLMTLTDGFHISVIDNRITVVGRNGRGAAYGLLELSRLAGVSPWIWWGDIVPERRSRLSIDSAFRMLQGASVEYRGVFLNDEDWSLRPWSYGTYEPAEFGQIGPRTYKKVFQLLLRMRANAIWPGMHTGTKAFFRTKGAKAVADSCGIAIGTSHCEPLLRNNVDEWNEKERGRFNYITNRQSVQNYWIERLKEVKGSAGGNMFTIGMRGIHDGSMEGVKTMDEKFNALQQVIDDQQELLRKYIGAPEKQTQVFVPYKEVLQIYERGLKVPDYVTLMWCDDNYGYLTRLSDKEEQKRPGGGGVYYHLSYWGRPHDYLWLTTTQPGLICDQMHKAYDNNVRKLWIANVHDPKVAGYDLELFLDMAWDINSVDGSNVDRHYKSWLTRQFGSKVANIIYPYMMEFYRLTGQRKPEFMGWTQVEKDKKLYERGLTPVRSTEFSGTEFGGELDRYIADFDRIADVVDSASSFVDKNLLDAYYAAIIYPVCASSAHARSLLMAQKARQLASGRGSTKDRERLEMEIAEASLHSMMAYQEVKKLTEYYNNVVSDGKWRGSMDMRPRDLPVFFAPSLPTLPDIEDQSLYPAYDAFKASETVIPENVVSRSAAEYDEATGEVRKVGMLGHSMNAVAPAKGSSMRYSFDVAEAADGVIRVAVIPTHALDGKDVRFSVSVDGAEPTVYNLKEPFRSEQWKENVLRGQALRTLPVSLSAGKHTLEIKAIDDNIVVDQWMWDSNPSRRFYLFPQTASEKK